MKYINQKMKLFLVGLMGALMAHVQPVCAKKKTTNAPLLRDRCNKATLYESLPNAASSVMVPSTMAPSVTVYVHGTTGKLGMKFLTKCCPVLTFGAQGLHPLSDLPETALMRQDALNLHRGDPIRFDIEHFYTFGWSGKLSFKARKQAGLQLYEALQKLLREYKEKYGMYPTLRILTFSHGGNVALNMVRHLPYFAHEPVTLELILVACPVQKRTEDLIHHECISTSYMVSSTRDLLQVMDLYWSGNKLSFPKRFFENPGTRCRQIKVSLNSRGLCHIDLMRSFMMHLPKVLKKADMFFQTQDDETCWPCLIEYEIVDKDFVFYRGSNLLHAVTGYRKNEPDTHINFSQLFQENKLK